MQTLLFAQVFNLGQTFQVTNLKPRQDQQARLNKVRFFAHPATAGGLRVACLCLQLTTYCTSLVAQQKREGPGAALAHLAKGDVQMKAGQLATEQIPPCVADDPVLPTRRALDAILVTLGHLVGRFAQYKTYPTLLLRLCRKLNPTGWMAACSGFLQEEPGRLDAGYGRLLQREALGAGSEADAVNYLMSEETQE